MTLRAKHFLLALLVGVAFFIATPYVIRMDDDKPAVHSTAVSDKCPRMPPSKLATKYLGTLHGIEIGASTQNAFDLKRAINVDFSDEQGGLWQDKACPPAVVNIVALGDDRPFKDKTLDYVLTSHVIEHFFDPVKALKEWYRVIRPGGYIFIIAPHMDRTFDQHREPTSPAELLDRAAGRITIQDYARPLDAQALKRIGLDKLGPLNYPQRLVRDKRTTRLEEGWAYYDKDDHHHWSAWRTADFVELAKKLDFKIVEAQDIDDKVGNGFTVVIRKPWSGLNPENAVSRP
ncbi:MAG: class I SAM-dependent methyltransferase [Betaproteobacteria bacterium]